MARFPTINSLVRAIQHLRSSIYTRSLPKKTSDQSQPTVNSTNAAASYTFPHLALTGGRRLYSSSLQTMSPSTPSATTTCLSGHTKLVIPNNTIVASAAPSTNASRRRVVNHNRQRSSDLLSATTAATQEAESEWSKQAIEAVAERTRRILRGGDAMAAVAAAVAGGGGGSDGPGGDSDDSMGSWSLGEEESEIWERDVLTRNGEDVSADGEDDEVEMGGDLTSMRRKGSDAVRQQVVVGAEWEEEMDGEGTGFSAGADGTAFDGGLTNGADATAFGEHDFGLEVSEDEARLAIEIAAWKNADPAPAADDSTIADNVEAEESTIWSEVMEVASDIEEEPDIALVHSTFEQQLHSAGRQGWHRRAGSVLERGVHVGRGDGCSIL